MISPRGMYMRNIVDIIPNVEYIRNAYMKELYAMSCLKKYSKNKESNHG